MKKNIAIILMTLLLLVFFTACSETDKVDTDIPTEETTETTESPTNIPAAKEFPEIAWPTFGAATKVPIPEWSTHGEILIDSETDFWAQVGYSTQKNYDDYMKVCQEIGFKENYYNMDGYMYYGENTDGYAVQLTYNKDDRYIAIQVTANADEWDKWWKENDES